MKKILIAEFKHETNSFMPDKSDIEAFRARNYLFGDKISEYFGHGVKNEIAAFMNYFADDPSYQLIPVIAFNAQPGGIVTRQVFETAREALLEAIGKTEGLDGILLALHGAMVVEGLQDGEGELLAALRSRTGPESEA